MSAMHIAAANGNIDIGQKLADRDAKLDAKDNVSSYRNFDKIMNMFIMHICCTGFNY